MKKIEKVLLLLSVMLISTTALAYNGYIVKNVKCEDRASGSSDTVYSTTGKVRLDVNDISDTTGCNYVKVFIMNTNTGKVTPAYYMYAHNTRFFSAEEGNLKAIFFRGSSESGKMNIDYEFTAEE